MSAESLYDVIIKYCNERYLSSKCNSCNHKIGCPGIVCGDCKQCLEEIHFQGKYPNGRKDYNCDRILNFYVCDYAPKYASEILYLLRNCDAMEDIDNYKVLSIGCGACPDLMALERFCNETSKSKSIEYIGVDINERWRGIHEQIRNYSSEVIKETEFYYYDATTDKLNAYDINIVVLQYVISHFLNMRDTNQINVLFERIVNSIIANSQDRPLVILVNDVNSVYMGRDLFLTLIDALKTENYHGGYLCFYFDHNIKNDAQRYGWKHESNSILFQLPEGFKETYDSWEKCSSAQLMIEIDV